MVIAKSFLDGLRDDGDVVALVGRYVELKKKGKDYLGLCPFHTEKNPSFTVSETKQFYHCFGCGEHGDAISFLMQYAGLSFIEAVEQLAGDQGKTVPRETFSLEQKQRQAQVAHVERALSSAKDLFHQALRAFPPAVQYLKARGLARETIINFGLGYANSDDVSKHLKHLGTQPLIDAGLLVVSEDTGEVYDRYRRRIMFPIHNERGVVVGFGGRVINDELPKYVNSPETAVFHKGDELYGLYFAKNEIRRCGTAVLFEGYMDVIMLHQHGDSRAVGALGTSLTEQQLRKLYRYADEIVFCFDGDRAGKAASDRAARMALAVMKDGKTARFLTLPGGHDPDSYVRQYGIEGWREQVDERAIPLSTKVMEMLTQGINLELPEGRAAVARAAAELLACAVHAPLYQAALRQAVEACTGLSAKPVTSRHERATPSSGSAQPRRDIAPSAAKKTFYQNYALLCGLDIEACASVPDHMMDDFASMISAWFVAAPTELADRLALNAADNTQLGAFIYEALCGIKERQATMDEASLMREVQAVIAAIRRQVEQHAAAQSAAQLFGSR